MLFREEVVRRKAADIFGKVAVQSGGLTSLLALLALSLASGVLALLVHGTYAPTERVPGYLTPDAGLIRINAQQDGIVTSVHVREGDMVEARQALFTINSPSDTVTGENVAAARIDALIQERNALEEQIRREHELASVTAGRTRTRIDGLHRQLELLESQQVNTRRRLALLEKDVERLESLAASGHLAANLLDARLVDLLDAREKSQLLEQEKARLQDEIQGLESELVQLPLRRDRQVTEIQARLLGVERALAAAETQWSRVVRAPAGGRITGLGVRASMQVTQGSVLVMILPPHGKMHAELLVPTRASGFLYPGQPVQIRLEAFPYQKFGLQRAAITKISRAVVGPEYQSGPISVPEPVYRVTAELESQSVTAYGSEHALQSGMLLEADIVREHRRLIEWIFDPLLASTSGI